MEKFTRGLENQPPHLYFSFSVLTETERVKNTLAKLDWYTENGYTLNLPKGLNPGKETDELLERCISSEFNVTLYQEKQNELQTLWQEIGHSFLQKLHTLGLPLQREYVVTLTRYGVGGSYGLPNQIVVNFEKSSTLARILPHEIIHLTIEHLIQENNIDHWTKERLVDLVYAKFFPENKRLQRDPDNSEQIEKIFNQHFPNIKKVILALHNV
jgi:hypothetical protein